MPNFHKPKAGYLAGKMLAWIEIYSQAGNPTPAECLGYFTNILPDEPLEDNREAVSPDRSLARRSLRLSILSSTAAVTGRQNSGRSKVDGPP